MKIGAGIVRYGRYVVFQLAEVALRQIDDLRPCEDVSYCC
jgi:hypothetical protein